MTTDCTPLIRRKRTEGHPQSIAKIHIKPQECFNIFTLLCLFPTEHLSSVMEFKNIASCVILLCYV